MTNKKTLKIDFSRTRLARLADDYYNEGKYIPALRFAHRELLEYGGDADVFARLCDIYEGMGLHESALLYWFRYLDVAEEQDLPDVYEGLATNFLSMGNERQAAYYYNRLVDADDTLPEETKMDIVDAFAKDKRAQYRFVYPPRLADYTEEISLASKYLKAGSLDQAIQTLEGVAVGSKEYASAKEMQAIAYLLAGKTEEAEGACKALLEEQPTAIPAMATLAAVYLEQGRREESLALAHTLAAMNPTDTDELYKIATVCCENELHEEAFKKFTLLCERLPYEDRPLYFKGVSAYKSGRLEEAEVAFDTLCTMHPNAEVAKYYRNRLREYRAALENGESVPPPELIYFYHLPQEEREYRSQTLLKIGACPKDEAQIFGLLALHDGYFSWCFDELDGGDRELQYLAIVTAAHVRADEFLQEVLLDHRVADVLKVEILRMLVERNEDMDVGLVLCNIYKRVPIYRIQIGRKRRKKFIEGYARVLSKFGVVNDRYCRSLQKAAERLYRSLEEKNGLDFVDNPDDVACAIYFLAGLHELGKDRAWVASAFDATLAKVQVLLTYTINKEEENEAD